jgi:hypothetical protein
MTLLHLIILASSVVSKLVIAMTAFAGWRLGKRLVNISRHEREAQTLHMVH